MNKDILNPVDKHVLYPVYTFRSVFEKDDKRNFIAACSARTMGGRNIPFTKGELEDIVIKVTIKSLNCKKKFKNTKLLMGYLHKIITNTVSDFAKSYKPFTTDLHPYEEALLHKDADESLKDPTQHLVTQCLTNEAILKRVEEICHAKGKDDVLRMLMTNAEEMTCLEPKIRQQVCRLRRLLRNDPLILELQGTCWNSRAHEEL